MKTLTAFASFVLLTISMTASPMCGQQSGLPVHNNGSPTVGIVYQIKESFIDVHGLFLYDAELGQGEPLVVLHGGPGGNHGYFLPYLLPLARTNRLIFMDERGSGRSGKLEDPSGYTVENMADDVEALRQALDLRSISLLGHSFGGVVAHPSTSA